MEIKIDLTKSIWLENPEIIETMWDFEKYLEIEPCSKKLQDFYSATVTIATSKHDTLTLKHRVNVYCICWVCFDGSMFLADFIRVLWALESRWSRPGLSVLSSTPGHGIQPQSMGSTHEPPLLPQARLLALPEEWRHLHRHTWPTVRAVTWPGRANNRGRRLGGGGSGGNFKEEEERHFCQRSIKISLKLIL